MKKIIGFLIASMLILGIGTSTLASCEEIRFGSNSVCVDIHKENNNTYELDVDRYSYSSYPSSAYYYILLPNKESGSRSSGGGKLSSRIGHNGGEFYYDYRDYDGYSNEIRPIKVYAIISNTIKSILRYYDFKKGDWANEKDYYGYVPYSSSSSDYDVDNFHISTNNSAPNINQRIDLRIKARDGTSTDTDYRGTVEFTIYYKTSSSSSRRSTTSSTYFELNNNYKNGYRFTSSDDGYVTLKDAIRFKQNYEYKVVVQDKNDDDIQGYTTFNTNNKDSGAYGFSEKEYSALKTIYDSWERMIDNLKKDYPSLKNNTTRKNMSDKLYDNMKEVIDKKSSRTFDDYDDFVDAFKKRYKYTIDNR